MIGRNITKLILYAALTLLVMTGIFLMSAQDAESSSFVSDGLLNTFLGRLVGKLMPSVTNQGLNHDIRKYAHVFEYFCLGVTSSLFFNELCRGKALYFVLSCMLGFFYACSDELHQTFVPGRSGQFSDVGIDFIGVFIGVASVTLICLICHRKRAEFDN